MQFFARELAVSENLSKETTANRFTAVDGDNSAAAVGMAEEMVTTFDANQVKPKTTQRLEEMGAGQRGKGAHAMTATR